MLPRTVVRREPDGEIAESGLVAPYISERSCCQIVIWLQWSAHTAFVQFKVGRRSRVVGTRTGGELGNGRLTSAAGLLLLVLLFLEGLTIPIIHRFLVLHIFVGFVLVPAIALKMASSGYRFAMYYLKNRRYRAVGAPLLPLRLLGPLLVTFTVVLMGSGIELVILGPGHSGIWKRVHIVSFVLWFGVMTVHVLAHSWKAATVGLSEFLPRRASSLTGDSPVSGVITRRSLIVASIVVGIALALSLLPLDSSWATFSGGH
jgi:hypothetical protein